MKCLKNKKTGNIVRVDNEQANQMVGSTWSYVPKSEWKALTRAVSEEQKAEQEKKEQTVSEKAIRHSKLKTKQRSADPIDNLLKEK